MDDYVNLLSKTAAVITGVASIIAALIATLAKTPKSPIAAAIQALFLFGHRESMSTANVARTPTTDPLHPAMERLNDAKAALAHQTSVARFNRWASGILTFCHNVIGGVLVLSFVQQSVDKRIVGIFGVLVLVSSLIRQHFRPDAKLRGALGRSQRLRALIRQAEDDVYAMQLTTTGAPTVDEFRRRISSALSEIESSELEDLAIRKGAERQSVHDK